MADPAEMEGSVAGSDRSLTIDYIKSNHFRVVHADGVYGGTTPNLNVEMVFWNSRLPIPQRVVMKFAPDGTAKETDRVLRCDQVREAEVAVVMSLDQAIAFHQWLSDRIETTKSLTESLSKGTHVGDT